MGSLDLLLRETGFTLMKSSALRRHNPAHLRVLRTDKGGKNLSDRVSSTILSSLYPGLSTRSVPYLDGLGWGSVAGVPRSVVTEGGGSTPGRTQNRCATLTRISVPSSTCPQGLGSHWSLFHSGLSKYCQKNNLLRLSLALFCDVV